MSEDAAPPRVGWLATVIGRIGAWIIYQLIWLFGRTRRWDDVPWLVGPLGGPEIGETLFLVTEAGAELAQQGRSVGADLPELRQIS